MRPYYDPLKSPSDNADDIAHDLDTHAWKRDGDNTENCIALATAIARLIQCFTAHEHRNGAGQAAAADHNHGTPQ